ncbi:hypothetical protein ACWEVP_50185 [Amycolatopsis sp. NPDC003865]
MTAPNLDDRERLCALLAMLPWTQDADGLCPPEALRPLILGANAESADEPDPARATRWGALCEAARHLGSRLSEASTPPQASVVLAMRVLEALEPVDLPVADAIGGMLRMQTAGRLWVSEVVAIAWRIASDDYGDERLADLQGKLGRA